MKPKTVKLNKKGQLTIPIEIRKSLNLSEKSKLSILVEDHKILLTVIPKDQAWFWTKEWQKGEAEADEDIKKGNLTRFNNVEDAIKFLDDNK